MELIKHSAKPGEVVFKERTGTISPNKVHLEPLEDDKDNFVLSFEQERNDGFSSYYVSVLITLDQLTQLTDQLRRELLPTEMEQILKLLQKLVNDKEDASS